MTQILIPVKALRLAKQRLGAELTPMQRASLALDMLETMLTTLAGCDASRVGAVWIIGRDQRVFEIASKFGAASILERAPDVDCAVESAGYNEAIVQGWQHLNRAEPVVVLPADIPQISCDEIYRLTAPQQTDDPLVRLAPAHDRIGTNGLYLSRPGLIKPVFGPNSFSKFSANAERQGIAVQTINSPGLAHDIDNWADLTRWINVSGYAVHPKSPADSMASESIHG